MDNYDAFSNRVKYTLADGCKLVHKKDDFGNILVEN